MVSNVLFNEPAATEVYTLSLHDALPISLRDDERVDADDLAPGVQQRTARVAGVDGGDRKSTRLNSSHGYISYAVFCLKKKTAQFVTDAPDVSKTSVLRSIWDALELSRAV